MVQFNYNGLANSGGIYVIFNSYNWRIYVGSTQRFKTRWKDGHTRTLLSGRHSNKFLLADFNKCREMLGHDDFLEFHIIKDMPNTTKEERLLEEEIWLRIHFDQGKNCYNLCDRSISREGFPAKDKEATRQLISENSLKMWANSEFRDKRLNQCRTTENRERSRSQRKREVTENGSLDPARLGTISNWKDPEKRQIRIDKIKIARARQIFTPETRRRLSEAQKAIGNHPPPPIKKPIIGTNVITGEVLFFDSIKQANENFGLRNKHKGISNVIHGRQKAFHGHFWKFRD